MSKGNWREFGDVQCQTSFVTDKTPKADSQVRVHRTKAGKGGKTVTVIKGLDLKISELKVILKKLL